MKTFALIAALALSLPGIADARKVTYYSDRDRDGHYVKRTKNVPDYGYRGHRGGYYGGYGRSYGGYGRSYYGRSYYGGYRPYYGRSYYGGYGYGYGYPSYYSSPGLSFVYSSSSPRYYQYAPSYRSNYSSLEV